MSGVKWAHSLNTQVLTLVGTVICAAGLVENISDVCLGSHEIDMLVGGLLRY